jgi:hypothetical protein
LPAAGNNPDPTPHRESRTVSRSLPIRLTWLLACVGAGALVGWAGAALTDTTLWYLAIPVAVAAGWLLLADPTRCDGPPAGGRRPES